MRSLVVLIRRGVPDASWKYPHQKSWFEFFQDHRLPPVTFHCFNCSHYHGNIFGWTRIAGLYLTSQDNKNTRVAVVALIEILIGVGMSLKSLYSPRGSQNVTPLDPLVPEFLPKFCWPDGPVPFTILFLTTHTAAVPVCFGIWAPRRSPIGVTTVQN